MADLPGLPALPGDVADLFEAVALIAGDLVTSLPGAGTEQWGIFLDGEPVVLADNVVSFDYRADFSLLTYPIEKGAFSTYNKVQAPFSVRVRFSTGGSFAAREAFLASIEDIIGDTNLYDVVTPETTYSSVSLTHQDYRRTASSGLGLLAVDVHCEQVRATASAQFSDTTAAGSNGDGTNTDITIKSPQSASAAPQVNGGTVQPSDAPASFSDRFSFT